MVPGVGGPPGEVQTRLGNLRFGSVRQIFVDSKLKKRRDCPF